MLSEEIIDKVIERLVNRIEEGNTYTLKKIGESIKKIGTLSPSKAQQLVQVLKYGGDYDNIVRKLAEITELNVKDIYKIFEEVAKNDYNFAKQFYDYRGKKFIPYEENIALQQQVRALANITAGEYRNLTRTMAFTKKVNGKVVYTDLARTYQDVLDKAVLSVAQGKNTFQDEMYSTIKELANSGIRTVNYGTNRSMRLDSAVRMQMKGALRTLHNETQEIFGEEFNSDGVEISVHLNPAPDHAEVQGRQFSKEEFNKFQNDIDAKDYKGKLFPAEFERHDRRSISEYNCYHYTFAIVLGVSKPEYSDEQLQEIINNNNNGFELDGKHYTNYEGTQLQRQLETEIRKQKDTQIMARASGNNELVSETQTKITQLTRKYKELSDVSGLPTKMDRMRVSGYRIKNTNNSINSSEQKTKENFKGNELINFVDIKELNKFKTHGKDDKYYNKTEEEYNELKQDILKNGIKSGGNLLYNETTGYTIINEGNNRLAIAQELGYKEFPIYVTKTSKNEGYVYDDRGVYLKKKLAKNKGKYIKYKDLKK